MRAESLLACAIILFIPTIEPNATAVAQTTWYVDDDAPNDPGPGDPTISDPDEDGSAEHPFDAIQEAIDAAAEDDTILLADGLYTGPGNRDIDYLGKLITVCSESAPESCVIDCQQAGRGFHFHNYETPQAALRGVTIRNGYGAPAGGILLQGANPSIENCIIADCFSAEGGGLRTVGQQELTLCDVTFVNNEAFPWGGGILNRGSNITCLRCRFENNTAREGGGFYASGGSAAFIDCIFVGNTAEQYGAGIYQQNHSLELHGCEFLQNWARCGGGLYSLNLSHTTVAGCEFTENIVEVSGAAIMASPGTIAECTFTGNRVTADHYSSFDGVGAGVFTVGASVTRCRFRENSAPGGAGVYVYGQAVVGDCEFQHNRATEIGGGVLCYGGAATLTNCLVRDNAAQQFGGGIAVLDPYDDGMPTIVNCTLARNVAGDAGGGLYHQHPTTSPALNNCILWLNTDAGGMDESAQLHFDGQPPAVNYCCVQDWSGALGGVGNIGDYPQFVAGYYLSQTAAGQSSDSPCVDAGDPTSDVPDGTTRTDGVPDAGVVDMGYHYPEAACIGDLNGDGMRNVTDFALWAAAYPSTFGDADFDPTADLDGDGTVNVTDLMIFLSQYGQPCP